MGYIIECQRPETTILPTQVQNARLSFRISNTTRKQSAQVKNTPCHMPLKQSLAIGKSAEILPRRIGVVLSTMIKSHFNQTEVMITAAPSTAIVPTSCEHL
jgi:hypothetical protein